MSSNCALTTIDNPFDPIEQFIPWLMFDIEKGYNSCGLLARIAHYSDGMTEQEMDQETERAIDEIIKYDLTDCYKKVKKTIVDEEESTD